MPAGIRVTRDRLSGDLLGDARSAGPLLFFKVRRDQSKLLLEQGLEIVLSSVSGKLSRLRGRHVDSSKIASKRVHAIALKGGDKRPGVAGRHDAVPLI